MEFQIEVIQSKVETKPTAKGSYQQCELTYKRLDTGKIESKKVMSFTNKEIFGLAAGAAGGAQFTVEAKKGEQYWEWVKLTPGLSTATAAPKAAAVSTRSTYETPEERAKKQVYIIKQSSLSAAVNLLGIGAKTPPSTELVIAEAQKFTDWVLAAPDIFTQPNDIEVE